MSMVKADGGEEHWRKDKSKGSKDGGGGHRGNNGRGEVHGGGGTSYRGKDRCGEGSKDRREGPKVFGGDRHYHKDVKGAHDDQNDRYVSPGSNRQREEGEDSKQHVDKKRGKEKYARRVDGEGGRAKDDSEWHVDGKGGRGKDDSKQLVGVERGKHMDNRHRMKDKSSKKGNEARADEGSNKTRKRKAERSLEKSKRPESEYFDVHDIPTETNSDESETLSDLEESVFHENRLVNTRVRFADDLLEEETQHKRRRHSSRP